MRQVILDTETTGIDPKDGHRLVEIGAVEMVNRRFTGRTYHQYINPERHIDAEVVAVHGIDDAKVANEPVFAQVADDFWAFIDGAELVIHNAPFDVGFIDHELNMLNKRRKSPVLGPVRSTAVSSIRWSWPAKCTRASATIWMRSASGMTSIMATGCFTGPCWMRKFWPMSTWR